MSNKVSVEVSANVQGFEQGMNKATNSAKKYETETRKISESTRNFRKEFMQAKRQVQDLSLAYSRLDKETRKSQFGIEMKRQLDAAKESASQLYDMQMDLQQELRNMASDTKTFDQLSQGVNVFMNATSAALGVVAQFTGNEEDAQKAVVAFTTAQSTLNAVTTIQNALQKQSSLMIGINTIKTKAATAAANMKAAAEGRNVVATKAAVIAQKAFNVVANANPYVLLTTAIIAVTGAIAGFIAMTSDAEDEEERHQAELEKTRQKIEEQRKAYVDATAQYNNTASRISHLRDQYLQTNDELAKTAILQEAASEFKKLGIEINGVTDAQRVLVNQGDKVVQLLRIQGNVAAISAMRMKAYIKHFQVLLENGSDIDSALIRSEYDPTVVEMDKRLDKYSQQINQLNSELNIGTSFNSPTRSNASSSNVQKAVEKEISTYTDAINEYDKLINEKKKLDEMLAEGRVGSDFIGNFAMEISAIDKKLEDLSEKWHINPKIEAPKAKEAVKSNPLADAISGNFAKSISGYESAISEIQKALKQTDWSAMGESGNLMFASLTQQLMTYKEQLASMNKVYEESMLTPQEIAIKNIEKQVTFVNRLGDSIKAAGQLFSALGDATEDEGLNKMGIVAQAIATVALSYAQALSSAKHWTTWLAFGLTGLATMSQMISQIKQSTSGYAEGGIVGGSSYSGDNIMSRLNSGEMVLNKRQQRNLFNLLDQGLMPQKGGSNIQVTGVIHGTDLLLVQKNTNKVRSKSGTPISF